MILIEKTEVMGFEPAIRGMRNPMNSWDRSDSYPIYEQYKNYNGVDNPILNVGYTIGSNDHELAMKLSKGGPTHAKFRRMISVYVDITAPLYWWKEFDTYKVGTVANSCSTMHKIHDKKFILEDFSHDQLSMDPTDATGYIKGVDPVTPLGVLIITIRALNMYRDRYLETKDKKYWWQMIQLLPSSYNQKRTIMFNYEVLYSMHKDRKGHKLDEWGVFCDWIDDLPYSELIVAKNAK